MKLGLLVQITCGVTLLGFGLYGAFLAGRAQSPSIATLAVRDDVRELRNQVVISSDGRFGTKCGRARDALCQVPFVRLIAFPEKYQGQRIMVAGLLAVGAAGVALYPSKESAQFGTGDAIWLEDKRGLMSGWPPFVPEAMWPQIERGVWVTLVGTFDAVHQTQQETIAILRDVERVEDLPEYRFRALPIVPSPPKLQAVPPQIAQPPQFETRPDTPQ